ncbi:MAG TPA: type VI secretion system protein TssA [Gemmatimonadaceae bacterium]|nr:type VI secretion system protein TssA [Gemmatimonadaceae bacterium]
MPLRNDLLTPIAGDNPAGVDLREDKIWDVIKEARRADIVPEEGRAPKIADWAAVVREASNALATRSKDLQLAVWLIEANFYRESFAGIAQAVQATAGLLTAFWDSLYPALEDGDAGFRISLLEYFNRSDRPLYAAIRLSPVTPSGITIYRFRESEDVGFEKPDDDYDKKQARKKKVDSGMMSGEEFGEAFKSTPKVWYKQRMADIESALAAIAALDKAGNEVFGRDAPGYTEFRKPIEEVQGIVRQLLNEKLKLEPDPVEAAPAEAPAAESLGTDVATPVAAGTGALSLEPTSRDDATGRVVVAARWLRKSEPTSPTSYMMLRALRWGELRAQAPEPDPRLLAAPAPASRTQLRTLMLDSKWAELLETSESVMATPAGRGWLDVQRYALRAVSELGPEYGAVGSAIKSELRALLREVPGLVDMTMMDGLPTASPETRNWLRVEFAGAEPEEITIAADPDGGSSAPLGGLGGADGRDRGYERALGEVRAGRAQKAIEMLFRELDREKSARARFLRQAQITRIMVDSGFEAIARPILDDMLQRMENHKLEEWEAGPLLAQPLSALYQCLVKTGEDSSRQQQVYLRICRLDPVAAMSFGQRS